MKRNYPKSAKRFLGLFLSIVLSLPNPAFALKPTETEESAGLEELDRVLRAFASGDPKAIKTAGVRLSQAVGVAADVNLPSVSPPSSLDAHLPGQSSTGLEERKWDWNRWMAEPSFKKPIIQTVWEFIQKINPTVQEMSVRMVDGGGLLGGLLDDSDQTPFAWVYPRHCETASRIGGLLLAGRFSGNDVDIRLASGGIFAPPYLPEYRDSGIHHVWLIIKVRGNEYYLSFTDGHFAWQANVDRVKQYKDAVRKEWDLFSANFVQPYRKLKFDQPALIPWEEAKPYFKIRREWALSEDDLSDLKGAVTSVLPTDEAILRADSEFLELLFKGLASLPTHRGYLYERDPLEWVLDRGLFNRGSVSWMSDQETKGLARVIREITRTGQGPPVHQIIRSVAQAHQRWNNAELDRVILEARQTTGLEETAPDVLPGQSVREVTEQRGGMVLGAAQQMAGQLYVNRPDVQRILQANGGRIIFSAEIAGKLSGRSDAFGGLLISGFAADLPIEDFMVIADSDLSNPAAQHVLAWIPGGSDSRQVAKTLGALKAGPRQIALFEEEPDLTSERIQALIAESLTGSPFPRSVVGTQEQVRDLPVAAFKILGRMKGLPDVVFLGVALTFKDQYDQQYSLIVWTQA